MSALPLKADRTGIVRLFVQEYRERRKKPQPLTTGASWQSGSKLEFGPSRAKSGLMRRSRGTVIRSPGRRGQAARQNVHAGRISCGCLPARNRCRSISRS